MPAGSFFGALLVTQLALVDKLGRKKYACKFDLGSRFHPSMCYRRTSLLPSLHLRFPSHVFILHYKTEYRRTHLPIRNLCPTIHGRMVSLQQWSITWGILIQYFIQFGCSYINGKASFRIPWGLQTIPALILFAGMLFFPESPRWLLDRERHVLDDEALIILADLHSGGDKNNELARLEFEEIRQHWGRRLMLNPLFMSFFLYFVSTLQARSRNWGVFDNANVWVIEGHDSTTIVCSYLFVCSFAVTMGLVSWTYPAGIYRLKIRGKAVSLAIASNWIFNLALAWAVPPGFEHIAWRTYCIFGTYNFVACVHIFFPFPPDLHIMSSFPKTSPDVDQNEITLYAFIHSQHNAHNSNNNSTPLLDQAGFGYSPLSSNLSPSMMTLPAMRMGFASPSYRVSGTEVHEESWLKRHIVPSPLLASDHNQKHTVQNLR
ncbi:hypothetical protein K435DRAFT_961995 [Dendrothele bispora CBS 962.96]|uniref:Major facilitator superfamily (MFS) profile domain-containing protein n=1 Tax=Dendrothele bispora (strain CBS 962.96) TaxID=1314807 RepID=A0A4S8MMV0_DENBC|nr:hypothetical protein K435DRAFT_961995 [Dendrothele bispora CBS 962.96]